MDLLERVKWLCSEKGISQRKLEAELGLSNGASSKWNKSSPSGDVLQKVADYFEVSIDYLLGRTDIKNPLDYILDKDYKFSTNLSFSQFDALMKWSEDRLFKKHETAAVRSHMAELFSRYKIVIERLAYIQRDWDRNKETFGQFYKEKSNPLSDREIKELFLKQELEGPINSLAAWVKNLPTWVTIQEEQYMENSAQINGVKKESYHLEKESYHLPNAANEIEGASNEDKAHDDALMDDDDF